MSTWEDAFGCGLTLGGILTLVLCVGVGGCFRRDQEAEWRHQAIEHGFAEYVLNPQTGESTWRWKDQTPEATK